MRGARYVRQARQAAATHLMPTRSPTFSPARSAPSPSFATNPTPSWPPTWPSWVGCGKCAHCWVSPCGLAFPVWSLGPEPRWRRPCLREALTYTAHHDAVIRVAYAGMGELDQDFAWARLGRFDIPDGDGARARVVVDTGLVHLGNGDVGRPHLRIADQVQVRFWLNWRCQPGDRLVKRNRSDSTVFKIWDFGKGRPSPLLSRQLFPPSPQPATVLPLSPSATRLHELIGLDEVRHFLTVVERAYRTGR